MIDRRRPSLSHASPIIRAAALALALSLIAAPASAESAKPLDDDVLLAPPGPIVDGKKIQPRADQTTTSGSGRLSDDPKLKELYEGVMRDSDPSTYRRNREPVAH